MIWGLGRDFSKFADKHDSYVTDWEIGCHEKTPAALYRVDCFCGAAAKCTGFGGISRRAVWSGAA